MYLRQENQQRNIFTRSRHILHQQEPPKNEARATGPNSQDSQGRHEDSSSTFTNTTPSRKCAAKHNNQHTTGETRNPPPERYSHKQRCAPPRSDNEREAHTDTSHEAEQPHPGEARAKILRSRGTDR